MSLEDKWGASLREADEDSVKPLRLLLSLLRAQYWFYQTAHWQAKGPPAYGNHLLFQRLYETVQEEIDTLAEKLVGYYGNAAVDPNDSAALMQGWLRRWTQESSLFAAVLLAERDFQAAVKQVYDILKSYQSLSLGLDDFLMGMASTHETHCYLLQQVVATPPSGPPMTRQAEMLPIEKTWGGYSSFRPIRRGEDDEDGVESAWLKTDLGTQEIPDTWEGWTLS